jgi:two-component system nitrogen regulation response regulator NtrX
MITGESGTGKEVVARTIHKLSRREGKPFLAINAAAIPESLIESELFGHERGAFTGAVATRQGVFEQANGGTLLIDEIAEMPMALQPKLLRVLADGKVRRLGGSYEFEFDVRVLAATNRDPMKAIEDGKLREDLYYRLNVVPIALPPLRARGEDVPLLIQHFVREFNTKHHISIEGATDEAVTLLKAYSWPGNVRELRNTIERVVIMHQNPRVSVKDLPAFGEAEPPASSYRFPSFKEASDAYHREFIQRKLEEADGNVSRAAELMGIDRSHLYRRMKALGLSAR